MRTVTRGRKGTKLGTQALDLSKERKAKGRRLLAPHFSAPKGACWGFLLWRARKLVLFSSLPQATGSLHRSQGKKGRQAGSYLYRLTCARCHSSTALITPSAPRLILATMGVSSRSPLGLAAAHMAGWYGAWGSPDS